MPDWVIAPVASAALCTVLEAVVLGGAWLYLRWRDRKLPEAERERLSDVVRRVLEADKRASRRK